ncbi:MAG: hypothetical protein ACI4E1_05950 [Lachnospira sp.]
MKLFRKLFAEKILSYYEGVNKAEKLLRNMPVISLLIKKDSFGENSVSRRMLGIVSQLCVMLWEFLRKYLYVLVLIYTPYIYISMVCPLIKTQQEVVIIYMFLIMTVICGSLANNTLLSVSDRDYLMIRVMQVSPYMNFLGKLIYKMVTDFLYFFIILIMFGVTPAHSFGMCLLLTSTRPVGEMLVIISYEHIRSLYENRSVYNGVIMAVSMLLAYGVPLMARKLSPNWIYVVHPFIVIIAIIIGAGAMYFLWWYKFYRKIIREAMHIKRED